MSAVSSSLRLAGSTGTGRGPQSPDAERASIATEIPDENFVGYLGSLPDKARGVLGDSAEHARGRLRAAPQDPTALERVMCVRDLLHDTVDRLQQLIAKLGPVEARCHTYEPIGGYHRWDPEEVTLMVATESAKLANMAANLITTETLGARTRQGLALITVDLLEQVVAVTDAQFAHAELARACIAESTGME